jgi:hypothetical protein
MLSDKKLFGKEKFGDNQYLTYYGTKQFTTYLNNSQNCFVTLIKINLLFANGLNQSIC